MTLDPRKEWLDGAIAHGAAATNIGDQTVIDAFGNWLAEHQAGTQDAAILDRADRGMLRMTGKDRANWLHNLVTNQVKTLAPRDGQYAFAINIKGRILFDLYILALADEFRLDIDRRWTAAAMRHFNKYIITEDVRLADASSEFNRLTLVGPRSGALLAALGLPQAATLPLLQSATWSWQGHDIFTVRADGFGVLAFDLMFPPRAWTTLVDALTSVHDGRAGATWMGRRAAETLRIEAGIPAPFAEINDDVLPAETGQLSRAVSFNKGCYLGQEIVERMRSRHALARALVGVVSDDDEPGSNSNPRETHAPPEGGGAMSPGVKLLDEAGQPAGTVTSICHSPSLGRRVGLAYVKTAHAHAGARLRVESQSTEAALVTVADVPLVRHSGA